MMDGHDDVLFCVETNDFAKHLTDIKLLLRCSTHQGIFLGPEVTVQNSMRELIEPQEKRKRQMRKVETLVAANNTYPPSAV